MKTPDKCFRPRSANQALAYLEINRPALAWKLAEFGRQVHERDAEERGLFKLEEKANG